MRRRNDRAFSLLEVLVTIVILAILILLSVGSLRRYRATVALRTSAERLIGELQTGLKQTARTSNCPQLGVTRMAPTTAATGQAVTARIIKKVQGLPLEIIKEWQVGDESGTSKPISVETPVNLPKLDYSDIATQGVALEFGLKSNGVFEELFCVPVQEDGTLWTDPAQATGSKTGSFVLNNDYSKSIIEISPVGNVKITDNI